MKIHRHRHLLPLIILLALLSALPLSPLRAFQVTADSGCNGKMLPVIAATTTKLDYAAACAGYNACVNEQVAEPICQMRVLVNLEVTCQQSSLADDLCETRAKLYAATISLLVTPFWDYVTEDSPQKIQAAVPEALAAFDHGDYETALVAYRSVPVETYQSAMLPLSIGLVLEAAGDDAAALEAYNQAWKISLPMPVFYDVRGKLFARMGSKIDATIDFNNMAYYLNGDAPLEAYLNDLLAQYPLDTLSFEDWTLYPVIRMSGGPGGGFFTDQSLEPAKQVRFAYLDDAARLIAAGFEDPDPMQGSLPPLVRMEQTDNGHYEGHFPYDLYFGYTLSLDFSGENGQGSGIESLTVFESTGNAYFLLSSPKMRNSADPRLYFERTRCAGAPLSRFATGMNGVVASWTNPVNVYAQPQINDQLTGNLTGLDAKFKVLAGPVCAGGFTWWQIEGNSSGDGSDTVTGWIQENSDVTNYQVNPSYDFPVIPPYCAVALPPRLVAGKSGMVIAGQGANKMRNQPALNGEVVGSIPENATFDVLSGPICADSYTWWQVKYNGVVGWTAEGEGETYWLQPE